MRYISTYKYYFRINYKSHIYVIYICVVLSDILEKISANKYY